MTKRRRYQNVYNYKTSNNKTSTSAENVNVLCYVKYAKILDYLKLKGNSFMHYLSYVLVLFLILNGIINLQERKKLKMRVIVKHARFYVHAKFNWPKV
jgi:hypothetical protein